MDKALLFGFTSGSTNKTALLNPQTAIFLGKQGYQRSKDLTTGFLSIELMLWIKPNNIKSVLDQKSMYSPMFIGTKGKLPGFLYKLIFSWYPKRILSCFIPVNLM